MIRVVPRKRCTRCAVCGGKGVAQCNLNALNRGQQAVPELTWALLDRTSCLHQLLRKSGAADAIRPPILTGSSMAPSACFAAGLPRRRPVACMSQKFPPTVRRHPRKCPLGRWAGATCSALITILSTAQQPGKASLSSLKLPQMTTRPVPLPHTGDRRSGLRTEQDDQFVSRIGPHPVQQLQAADQRLRRAVACTAL